MREHCSGVSGLWGFGCFSAVGVKSLKFRVRAFAVLGANRFVARFEGLRWKFKGSTWLRTSTKG